MSALSQTKLRSEQQDRPVSVRRMNPDRIQRERRNLNEIPSDWDQTPSNVQKQPADGGIQRAANRQPQHSGGFTVIPPIESRRSKIKAMAQKEEEDFQRYKEMQKPSSVHVNPERLGGDVSLAEARQKQFTDLRSSKLQKKFKKEELEKKKKLEEEEELQRMKDKQREKSERLEERRQQNEERRRERFHGDHSRKNERLLQEIETRAADLTIDSAQASSRIKESENKQTEKRPRSTMEVQLDHKRVNEAFLDRFEHQGREHEKETKKESIQDAERARLVSDDFKQTSSVQAPLCHPEGRSGWAEESEPEPDHNWALMKLMSHFPDYARSVLEEILNQTNGDYEQAYALLS